MQTTGHIYVIKDEHIMGGEPVIKDTRTSVRAIAEIWRLGTLPEEITAKL